MITTSPQAGNISEEVEMRKRDQTEVLELKSTKTEMKNVLEGSIADPSRQKKESVNVKTALVN